MAVRAGDGRGDRLGVAIGCSRPRASEDGNLLVVRLRPHRARARRRLPRVWYAEQVMKPHPRIRKRIKWGGGVVTVLLVVAWGGSVWGRVIWYGSAWAAGLCVGCVGARGDASDWGKRPTGLVVERSAAIDDVLWWPELDVHSKPASVLIPLWMLVLASLTMTMIAWVLDARVRRRSRAGCCITCGYDRAGLAPDAVCPECGAERVASAPRSGAGQ